MLPIAYSLRFKSIQRTSTSMNSGKDNQGDHGGNVEAAAEIGKKIAAKALEKGITEVVFDRGGYVYHGRVKALADGAREGGLKL